MLSEAGVDPAATQLVSTSADGFTAGTPVAAVMDGRDAMLAISMNGEPLPIEHGFPVRMVVPGLYGYVSATKWVVDLELTTFDRVRPLLDPPRMGRAGPDQDAVTHRHAEATGERARRRRGGRRGGMGPAPRHRRAWRCGSTTGAWQRAELATEDTIDTWRQWRIEVPLTAGNRTIQVRATDGDGEVQTAERAEPFPDGATGQHSIVIQVG